MNLLLNIRAKYCFLRANGVYYNCQQKGVDRMARNTTNISIRMDADLKAQADALFTELGMNLTTAFNIFVRQSLRWTKYTNAKRLPLFFSLVRDSLTKPI